MSNALVTPGTATRSPMPKDRSFVTMGQAMAPRSTVRYCAVALVAFGKSEPFWLQHEGKIIVFETPAQAQDFIEFSAEGRDSVWDAAAETCTYSPAMFQLGKINQAIIVTGYDLYNTPAMHAVPSEVRGREWRHHILWGHWFRGVFDAS